MNYITGETVKNLREQQKLTQKALADKIGVSDKTVSKWETGRGLPDIGIIEPLATALGVSLPELLTGELKMNRNISGNMLRSQFYVCPICGNIISAMGESWISCCGITLPKQLPEPTDEAHGICLEAVEDEILVTLSHPMSKQHYISFIAYVTCDSLEIVKLYPEQDACVRFRWKGSGIIYAYCNRHGLFQRKSVAFPA